MSITVLLITHQEIANAFLHVAKTTFHNDLPLPISTVEVQPETDPETFIPELKRLCSELDQGQGILILADLYGATPNNVARALIADNVRLVSGLNLPMLLKILNYAGLTLSELSEKAIQAGQCGIMECKDG